RSGASSSSRSASPTRSSKGRSAARRPWVATKGRAVRPRTCTSSVAAAVTAVSAAAIVARVRAASPTRRTDIESFPTFRGELTENRGLAVFTHRMHAARGRFVATLRRIVMADITAGMVKELRERTQAGMSDCKAALVEAGGDMEKAVEVILKKGIVKAAARAGRVATEGEVRTSVAANGKHGTIVEVNCQTDFVARG